MSDTVDMSTPVSPATVLGTHGSTVIGCVKFFDKNAGFGFITVLKNTEFPQFSEKDIFVHYSGIHIESEQYKYLVKGEYVEFKIVPSTKPTTSDSAENEKYIAVDITGIQGGKLMCQTNFTEYIPKTTRSVPQYQTYYGDEVEGDDMDVDVITRPVLVRRQAPQGVRKVYVRPQYVEKVERVERIAQRTTVPSTRPVRQLRKPVS